MKTTCFVIMPFGKRNDGEQPIDFDAIYKHIIKPAVLAAGLKSVRSDEILEAGWIHKKMIDHIYRAAVAIVDITTLNANVFWELGVRHALRSHATILIRKKGTALPFNIQDLNLVEYDVDLESAARAQETIATLITAAMEKQTVDSLVHDLLTLKIDTSSQLIAKKELRRYRVSGAPDKEICIVTGDIQNITGIDVWVSSENTNMQMARFYDRSVSSVIRYHGSERDQLGNVVRDVIADDLAKRVSPHKTVNPGTVVETTSGELQKSHGVRKILHAAAVAGSIGNGYSLVKDFADCVPNALRRLDELQGEGSPFKSVLFPLFGAGTAGEDLRKIVRPLLEAAITYFQNHPQSTVESAHFIARKEDELAECLRALSVLPVTKIA
jgi:O-acetyl-ADP-ribose deacetylase (regulator of RNase III)